MFPPNTVAAWRQRNHWCRSLTLITILVSVIACKHEPPVVPDAPGTGIGGGGGEGTPCDPNTVYFEQQVLPLLVSNCAMTGCHNVATGQNDHIQLTSYASLMASDIVEPGDPFDGDLWEVINDNDPDDRMPPPPRSPLTAAQIALIGTWLQQGAQNNSCTGTCDTTNVTYSGSIQPIITAHCLGCHSGASPQGGVNLGNWATLNTLANSGTLAGVVQHTSPFPAMPPSGPGLSSCNVEKIKIWIADGAPNN